MTEKQVKEILDFLCEKYRMTYAYAKFEKYLGTNAEIETYNYHNKHGCFSITNVPVRGDIEYIHLDSISLLRDFLFSETPNLGALTPENEKEYRQYFDEKQKHKIRIFDFESEIWAKHKKSGFLKIPFFWGSEKQVLRALAEVIEAQIQKTGQFFGIKVK